MFPKSLARRAAAVTISVAAALALAGCTSSPPTVDAQPAGDATPQEGGDLTIAGQGSMTCIDPWQMTIRFDLQWQRQLNDSLVYEDVEGNFHPWLAESFEANEDATEFRFTLRDDVMFSDGSALDAEAVRANLDALKADPVYTIARGYLADYTETVVEDERTAVIRFAQPNAPFLYGLSTPNMSMTSLASASLPAAERCAGAASGSGPFVLGDVRPGEQVVLTKNEEYAWAPEGLANQGPAYLDSITINQVSDPMVISQTALAGEADMVGGVQENFVPQLEAEGWSRFSEPDAGSSGSIVSYPGRGILGTDEAVRRALNLALDREEIVGVAASTSVVVPSGVLNTAHPFYTDQSSLLVPDPAAAMEILEEAGWELGSDGIREKDGERLSVEVMHFSASYTPDMVAVAAQQAAEVGIELTMRPVTFAEEATVRAEGQIESRAATQTGAEPTVLGVLFDGVLPEGIPELLAAQNATLDMGERQAVVDDMTAMLVEEGWLVPLWQIINQPWRSSSVEGSVCDVGGLYMMSQLWLTAES